MTKKYTKHKAELREIFDQAYLKINHFIDDFLSESEDYNDFEERTAICDDLLDTFLDKTAELTNLSYGKYSDEFVPDSVILMSAFQSTYLLSMYLSNPTFFSNISDPEKFLSDLIEEFKNVLPAHSPDISFLNKFVKTKLRKGEMYDIVEFTFKDDKNDSPMVYDKMYFPFKKNGILETEFFVPFALNYSKNGKAKEIFFYEPSQTEEHTLNRFSLGTFVTDSPIKIIEETIASWSVSDQNLEEHTVHDNKRYS